MKKTNKIWRTRSALTRHVVAALSATVLGLALPLSATAQVIDKIDVNRTGDEAEIVIRFNTPVQYQRHSPPQRGEILNLYFQFLALDGTELNLQRQTQTLPRSDLLEAVTATYPEPNSAMSIRFGAPTNYRVRQGKDNRSISIFVPAKLLPTVPVAPALAAAPPPATAKPVPLPAAPPAPAVPSPQAVVPPATPQAPAQAATPAAPAPSQNAAVPSAQPKAELLPQPPVPSTPEIEAQAKQLLAQGKDALGRNDVAVATEALNKLLNLPPNAASQEGQELIGEAREKGGDIAKARAEYELYLKLYPQGPGAARVRERLAKLPTLPLAEAPAAPARPRRQEPTGWVTTGGWSQYRYYGNSSSNVDPQRLTICTPTATVTCPAGTITPEQLAAQTANSTQAQVVTQDTLVSSVDYQLRKRTETTDSRFVLRDIETLYYPQGKGNSTTYEAHKERLNAAYFEQSDRDRGYFMRLGRQTGSGGGVLGRFDGISAGYSLSPKWRINGVTGNVVEFGSPYTKNFYGLNVDLNAQAEQWGGNLFYIEQRFGSRTDRQAVGAEARYFDAKKNYFFTLDYDVAFDALNTAMFQGNWNLEGGTTVFMTVDRRRSPTLFLSSAVDYTQGKIDALIANFGLKAVRDDIKALTPTANSFALGFTRPINDKWQAGADYRVSNVSGTLQPSVLLTPGSVTLQPPAAASGNTHVFSAQAIGSNGIFATTDLLVVNGSYFYSKHTTAPYTAELLTINHVALPSEKWRFDTTLRLYWQKDASIGLDASGQKTSRIGPEFKALYKLRDNLSFEADASFERVRQFGAARSGDSSATNKYYYVGYRWDWL